MKNEEFQVITPRFWDTEIDPDHDTNMGFWATLLGLVFSNLATRVAQKKKIRWEDDFRPNVRITQKRRATMGIEKKKMKKNCFLK